MTAITDHTDPTEVTGPPHQAWRLWIGRGLLAAVAAGFLYLVFGLYLIGEPVLAVIAMATGLLGVTFFGFRRFYTLRFVYPGIAAVFLFILLPVIYTSAIGFTNFGARNLLTLDRVTAYHLDKAEVDPDSKRPFAGVAGPDGLQLYFPEDAGRPALLTAAVTGPGEVAAEPVEGPAPETLPMKEMIQNRALLSEVTVTTPDGLGLSMAGLRDFAEIQPVYALADDGTLVSQIDGHVLVPNHETGFFETEAGEPVAPGWRVQVGFDNFARLFATEGIKEPMVKVFIWTFTFAFLSMVLTFSVGLGLAVILEWPHLAFRGLYRVLLILPYAVPGFISMLVFRGLFNQNFGEINLILESLFGVAPPWFTDPFLSKVMLLIVNTWLGYPYMMLLAAGFLQAIPRDHYKAAALEGAGPVRSFFSITLPQILPPFVPLMIANFAFNFNNVVLILLLTRGGPDMAGTKVTVGHTDLLGSFTFRLAFENSAQDFGLAGAISTVIFIVTGAIAYLNFRAMQSYAKKKGAGA
ncbi:maltose ABC transporter permease MalF [Oceanomicrobium pacificus]|uniref:Maltose/maltodextrin transport system permease protein n=1 Tax=Oceanomicrobium pacificus TaxID=2692916 RepID=A0A6B0TVL0_9RHOB|nr:maltose ABC transporter permease MalF [Oceanomicrobium pacificus]MXU65262.1 maltose ABC transporter permease MalF [Oceanomicrobium pacificus]